MKKKRMERERRKDGNCKREIGKRVVERGKGE